MGSTGYDTSLSLERAYNPAGHDIVMRANTYLGNNANVGSMAFFNFKDGYYANLYEYSTISFELYCSIDYASAGRDGDLFQINFFTEGQDGFNAVVPASQIRSGWQWISIDRHSIEKVVDSAKWNQIKGMRFTWFNNTQGNNVTFGLDTIYASKDTKPRTEGDRLYINDCDSLYGWTTEYGASLSLSEANSPAGNYVNITANNCIGNTSSIGSLAKYSLGDNSADASIYNTLYLELKCSIDYSVNALRENDYFQINFLTSGKDGYKYDISASNIKEGWNYLEIRLSDFIKVSDVDWSNIKGMRFTWFNVSQGDAVEFALDTLYFFNKEYPVDPNPTPDSSSSSNESSSSSEEISSSSSEESSASSEEGNSSSSSSSFSQDVSSSSSSSSEEISTSSSEESSTSSEQGNSSSSSSSSSQDVSSSSSENSSESGSSSKKGCKSSLGGSSALIALCLIALIAIVKRKKN